MYNASRMAMTEAALDSGLLGDLYVSLGDYLGGQAWSLRLYHKPFVGWLWAGAVLLSLGGILAATGASGARSRGVARQSASA
jgi:cytochrome c-type biogenesis protein CcmF